MMITQQYTLIMVT